MDSRIEAIKGVLKKYGQEHLIQYYEKLKDTSIKARNLIIREPIEL